MTQVHVQCGDRRTQLLHADMLDSMLHQSAGLAIWGSTTQM